MARLLVVSEPAAQTPLPGLSLLAHTITMVDGQEAALAASGSADVVVLDARADLSRARGLGLLFAADAPGVPVLLVITQAALGLVSHDWGIADFLLEGADPAELDARIRMLLTAAPPMSTITGGAIEIDEDAYSVTLAGHPLDLTYTEFELLKYLLLHPGRVLTREQLLSEVWGYDYYGGTRTVDVHVRRLRAKLGPEHDSCIGTVRNVGYRFQGK